MKIESLRLKSFIGIQRGLSLPEISIDFSRISGLIAFDGANGAGKSTVLENLHPFPQLASREGALYQHVSTRNAEKELSFSYGGSSYRTLLKIDCQSGKSEGFIYKNGASKSETTGSIREYGKYVKDLLGSQDLFFASVFCAQGSKKLSDMTTGQLKGLFAEFLRLDRLQRFEETSKQIITVLSGKSGSLDGRRSALADRVAGGESLKQLLVGQRTALQEMEGHREKLRASIQTNRARADELLAIVAKSAAALSRKADMEALIARMEKDLAGERGTAEAELEALRGKYASLAAEIEGCTAVLKDKERILGAAERERAVNEQIQGLQEESDGLTVEIAAHRETIHALETEIQGLRREATKDPAIDTEIREIDAALARSKEFIDSVDRELNDLKNDQRLRDLAGMVVNAKEKMGALDQKDPACLSTSCLFIVSALEARRTLPELEKDLEIRNFFLQEEGDKRIDAGRVEIDKRNDLIFKRKARLDFLFAESTKMLAEIGPKDFALADEKAEDRKKTAQLADLRNRIAIARLELGTLKTLAARAAEVQVAEARKADLDQRLQEAKEAGMSARTAWEARNQEKTGQIGEHRGKLTAIEADIDQKAEGELKRTLETIEGVERQSLPLLEGEITTAREEIARQQGELTRLQEAEQELAGLVAERDRLNGEASEWIYLRNACSKTGLQALEIDGAAPLITSFANNLLSQAFGPLYSVRLRTQDDEGREVLDIVTIGEDGSEVLLDNLSGGQKVWCLMALRLAMTLLSREKSGKAFESFFSDEMDGPLDPENALNFINMYRAFMQTGGFSNGYFISHRPSCRALADAVLVFEPGKNPFWR